MYRRSSQPAKTAASNTASLTPINVLVAPSGFKGSLSPSTVADCITEGIHHALPTANVRKVPLVDGGEGFARALVSATNGTLHHLTVTGPLGLPVQSHFGILGDGHHCNGKANGTNTNGRLLRLPWPTPTDKESTTTTTPPPKTAVIEMAAAAGLALTPTPTTHDPTATTTFGVGQLLLAALDAGASRILLGCGDSATSDAGAGMLQALGARLLDAHGAPLPRASGGAALAALADVDLRGLDPRLRRTAIEVPCNWRNVLCGPHGVARVYGPQKGASEAQVEMLAAALERFASVVETRLGCAVASVPGGGASGGLGAGLLVLGATLRPRYEAVMEYFGIGDGELFDGCDLVFTAEGGIDEQTTRGKVPAEVAVRAKGSGIPVIVLAGTVGDGAEVCYRAGIDAYASILSGPASLEEAIERAEELLVDAAEAAMRMVMVGMAMKG
ncbi:glycerate kinase [Diplodia corticola]|uniref:Glycerate kinase n=1 Tax=Diplodia corticola TaxID=236234 RepID=A0A1J9SFX8_9PEZI|nr:glycerate kinase [Diplodia corticola]OJD38716.1 glycerate kinase [Diplodia corticola]